MLLFRVARYGNEDEGPDGNDTNFLVHANNYEEAVKLSEEYLRLLPHGEKVAPYCNTVVEIGNNPIDSEPRIIMGPCYEPSIQHVIIKAWYRRSIDEEWEEENI